jgi:SPOR domain
MKRLVVLLLLLNAVFFAWMQWGGRLGSTDQSVQPLAALNPEKIRLMGVPAASVPVASVAPVAPLVPPVVPVSAPVSSPVAPAARVAEKSCMEWGEFSGADLARAEKALAQLKLGDRLAQRTVEYTHGYWVYIAPLKKHANRVKKIQQLKELGVEDYFVVQESGQWMNAISLGVFKTEEAAKNYQAELNRKGVKSAQVGERAIKLKFTVFVLRHLDDAGAAQIATWQHDYAGSELKTVACNQEK